MPPKLETKWDSMKLMVSLNGVKWTEATEAIEVKENPILERSIDTEKERALHFTPTTFRFSFRVRWKKKTRLLQELGVLRRPKLTYKTNRKYKRPKHHRKH